MGTVISIGADVGGPEATELSELKVPFVKSLEKHVTSTHCAALDEYALVLRIDGRFAQFGPEGLARLRFAKSRRYITVDIQVPVHVWESMTTRDLKVYLTSRATHALAACIDRLEAEKVKVDRATLLEQVSAASAEFLASDV